jgi:hypothetical protein
VSISPGMTDAEVQEFVHQYELQPYGGRAIWLADKGVSQARFRRWRTAVFEGDLARGLIPREGSPMTVPPKKRTALETLRAREREEHAGEIARLSARVSELEEANAALGKAIGLLHAMSEEEPGIDPRRTKRSNS